MAVYAVGPFTSFSCQFLKLIWTWNSYTESVQIKHKAM